LISPSHQIHAHAEKFEPKVEYVFSYLQVFSACCVMFAHGAGEVGYMSGPLGAIVDIINTGAIHKTVEPVTWIIAICATGLIIGLATYGYNVVRAMGVRLAKLSPTRGFCAELSTAFVIMIASQYGLPTSSSQVITGGIVGIGLCEGIVGVNWAFFGVQFGSWVATMFVCGVGTAALFASGVYTPSMQMASKINVYEDKLGALTTRILNGLILNLDRFNKSASEGMIQRLSAVDYASMRAGLTSILANEAMELSVKVQTRNPVSLFTNLLAALSFVQKDSVLTIGQDSLYPGVSACFNGSSFDVPCVSPSLT
jgi:sodium-dependent phosphate transporter